MLCIDRSAIFDSSTVLVRDPWMPTMRETTWRYASARPLLHTRKRHMYAHAPPIADGHLLCTIEGLEHSCNRSMNRPFVVQTPTIFGIASIAHDLTLAFEPAGSFPSSVQRAPPHPGYSLRHQSRRLWLATALDSTAPQSSRACKSGEREDGAAMVLLCRPVVARPVDVMRVNLRPRWHGVHA